MKLLRLNLSGNLEKDFHAALNIPIRICQIFGLQSLNPKSPSTFKYASYCTGFYAVIFFPMWLQSVYSGLYRGDAQSIVSEVLQIYATFLILNSILVIIANWKFRMLLVRALNEFISVDYQLLSLGIKVDYKKAYKDNAVKLFAVVASGVIKSAFSSSAARTTLTMRLTIFMNVFVKALIKYQYVVIISCALQRFKLINARIQSFCSVTELRALCRLHYKLCNACSLLQACFGFQLVMAVFISFANILFNITYVYTVFKLRKPSYMYRTPTAYLLDEIWEIHRLITICVETCQVANQTGLYLHEYSNRFKFRIETLREIYSYSLGLLHIKLRITALNFLTLDYALIYNMFLAVSSNAIIFIQFDMVNII